jgi:hypothetical protein
MNNKTLIGIVAVGAALFFLSKNKKKVARQSKISMSPAGMKPARIGANEKVSAQSFVRLTKRRIGFSYVPAKMLPDGKIEFSSPKAGLFTRYVLESGGRIFAEVA